jgi:hypothetical protein
MHFFTHTPGLADLRNSRDSSGILTPPKIVEIHFIIQFILSTLKGAVLVGILNMNRHSEVYNFTLLVIYLGW